MKGLIFAAWLLCLTCLPQNILAQEPTQDLVPPPIQVDNEALSSASNVQDSGVSELNNKGLAAYNAGNYSQAMNFFLLGAKKGDAQSEFSVGNLYENGKGLKQDIPESLKWYQKAAEQGYIDAENNIACLYFKGDDVSQDYQEALKWYLKAANAGNSKAENTVGYCYVNGLGIDRDYKKAMEWYLKSAIQGNVDAEANIGGIYEDGRGVPQDYSEALKWYQKAADQGDAESAKKVVSLSAATNENTSTPTPQWYPIDDLLIAENSDIQANSGIHIQIDKLIGKLINGSFKIIAPAKGFGFIVDTAVSEFGGNNRTYYLRIPKKWKVLARGGYVDTTGIPNFGSYDIWILGVFPTKKFFNYKNDYGALVHLRILDLNVMAYPSPQ